MNIPKSIQRLADIHGCRVEVLRFKAHGQSQKGYAIVDNDNNELLEVEPVRYSNGDRWLVRNKCLEACTAKSREYIKTLQYFTAEIKPMHTGFKFSNR